MRALGFVLFAACLIALGAASASASESTWVFFVQAGDGGSFGAVEGSLSEAWARSMSEPGVVDDPSIKDPRDGFQWPPIGLVPGAATQWWRPWGGGGRWDIYSRDVRQPLSSDTGYVKRWDDLLVWGTHGSTGYQGDDIVLFISGAGVPNSINGQPIIYRLIMTWAPPAYWDDPATQKEWVLPPFPGTSDPTIKVPWYTITLPAEGALADFPLVGDGPLAATQVTGYRFSLVTPEPASLLGLSAGLVSLVSRMRRR